MFSFLVPLSPQYWAVSKCVYGKNGPGNEVWGCVSAHEVILTIFGHVKFGQPSSWIFSKCVYGENGPGIEVFGCVRVLMR